MVRCNVREVSEPYTHEADQGPSGARGPGATTTSRRLASRMYPTFLVRSLHWDGIRLWCLGLHS